MLCFSLLSNLKTAKNLISSTCPAGAVLLLVVLKQTQRNSQTQSMRRKWTRGLMWFKTCSNIRLNIVHPFCTCSVLHKCTISVSLLKALVQSQLRAFFEILMPVRHLLCTRMDQILKKQDKTLQLIYSTLVRNYEIYTYFILKQLISCKFSQCSCHLGMNSITQIPTICLSKTLK